MSIRVLIATDGSDEAVSAAERSLALIPPDADIQLVTVIEARLDPDEDAGGFEGPVMTEEEADEEYAKSEAAGQDAIDRTERVLAGRTFTERIVPSDGKVADALAELAEAEQIELLVVGSRQAGWFDRLLRGSTETQLIHRAPCPVLVMNNPQARRDS